MEIENKQKAFEDSKTCSYRAISNGNGNGQYSFWMCLVVTYENVNLFLNSFFVNSFMPKKQ